jgi:hypothetical protein
MPLSKYAVTLAKVKGKTQIITNCKIANNQKYTYFSLRSELIRNGGYSQPSYKSRSELQGSYKLKL